MLQYNTECSVVNPLTEEKVMEGNKPDFVDIMAAVTTAIIFGYMAACGLFIALSHYLSA